MNIPIPLLVIAVIVFIGLLRSYFRLAWRYHKLETDARNVSDRADALKRSTESLLDDLNMARAGHTRLENAYVLLSEQKETIEASYREYVASVPRAINPQTVLKSAHTGRRLLHRKARNADPS